MSEYSLLGSENSLPRREHSLPRSEYSLKSEKMVPNFQLHAISEPTKNVVPKSALGQGHLPPPGGGQGDGGDLGPTPSSRMGGGVETLSPRVTN